MGHFFNLGALQLVDISHAKASFLETDAKGSLQGLSLYGVILSLERIVTSPEEWSSPVEVLRFSEWFQR